MPIIARMLAVANAPALLALRNNAAADTMTNPPSEKSARDQANGARVASAAATTASARTTPKAAAWAKRGDKYQASTSAARRRLAIPSIRIAASAAAAAQPMILPT